jgi:DNA repair protein RadC
MRYTFKPIEFKSIKDMPKNMRPRERMQERGPLGISDLELLCILLGSGGKNRPVQDLAMEILEVIDLKGKRGVTPKDLEGIVGLGPAKAATICACLEFGRRMTYIRRKTLNDPYSIFEAVRHYGSRQQEYFLCVMLNGAHELMGINVVSIGLVNKTLVHPREIFADPLKERATAVVLAHNHPSGNLEPSDDDLATTLRIRKAGALLGIEVLDHIVFSEDSYRSMVESGEFTLG